MDNVRNRLTAFMTALVLVMALFAVLPQGALKASALSGKGTKSSPYVVTTYDELLKLMRGKGNSEALRNGEYYIKLGADISSSDDLTDNCIYITQYSTIFHFDLAGHKLSRKSTAEWPFPFIFLSGNSTLYIDDSVGGGIIEADEISSLLSAYDGALIINGGTFNTKPTYRDDSGSYFILSNGGAYVEINGGTFSCCSAQILNCQGGTTVFNGGKFIYKGNCTGLRIYTYTDDSCIVNGGTFLAENFSSSCNPSPAIEEYISEGSEITVDGRTVTKDQLPSLYRQFRQIDIKNNLKTVSSATLTVEVPAAGRTPSQAVLSTKTLKMTECVWKDKYGKELEPSATFQKGTQYTLSVTLEPKDGYFLSFNTAAKVNGLLMKNKPAEYPKLTFTYTFTAQRQVGDMDLNGKITADDAIIAARLAAGYGDYSERYDPALADINGDGKVTADDAIIIARYAAGYGDYQTRYTKYI